MNKLLLIYLCSFLLISVYAGEFISYRVKKGDTLIGILQAFNLSAYGKQGHLKQIIALNSKKTKKNGNLIAINSKLIVPVKIIQKKIASVELPQMVHEEHIAVEVKNNPFRQYSFFKLSPQFSWLAIKSVDDINFGGTDVSNLSKPSIGIRGEWRIMIQPESSLYVFSSLDSLRFYKDSTYSLSNTQFIRSSFGVGGELGLTTNAKLESSIVINESYFQEVVNPLNVQIRSLSLIELKTQYTRGLFSIDRVQSYWGMGGMLILPTSKGQYKAEVGYGFNLDMLTRFLSKEIQLSYNHKFFKINEIQNQSKEVMARMNFNLGREE